MTLDQFAKKHTIGSRAAHRNKIKIKTSEKVVIKFTPRLSCNKDSPRYNEYCRASLIRYKAWSNSSNELWGNVENPTAAVLKEKWEEYVSWMEENGQMPDSLKRARANSREFANMTLNELVDQAYQDETEPDMGVELAPPRVDWQDVAADNDDLSAHQVEPDDGVVDVQWDSDYDWSTDETYLDHVLPYINELKTQYSELLASEPPPMEGNDGPLGF
jgi:hypothetical protein